MSWSASGTGKGDGSFELVSASPPVDSMDAHVKEAYDEAVDAVEALLGCGAFGDADSAFTVTFSGHANPGHVPAAGWVNDCLSISFSQQSQ